MKDENKHFCYGCLTYIGDNDVDGRFEHINCKHKGFGVCMDKTTPVTDWDNIYREYYVETGKRIIGQNLVGLHLFMEWMMKRCNAPTLKTK